jgi:hypothetical protein
VTCTWSDTVDFSNSCGSRDSALDRWKQVLREARTQKKPIWNGSTMVQRNEFYRARGAMKNSIPGRCTAADNRMHRSIRYRDAQPREMNWVIIDLDDQPLGAGEITGATEFWPVASDENSFNHELDVRTTECHHIESLLPILIWPTLAT